MLSLSASRSPTFLWPSMGAARTMDYFLPKLIRTRQFRKPALGVKSMK